MAFPPFWFCCCLSFHWTIPSKSKRDTPFHCTAYDYFRADWDGFCDYLRVVPREDIFRLSTSAAANKFCAWIQARTDVYIRNCKYQLMPLTSSWFLAASAAAIVHRNHFFHLYLQNKSSESKGKFRQAILIVAKGFLNLLKVLIKQNCLSLPWNVALGTFGKVLIVFSTKVKLLYLLYSTAQRCFFLLLIKPNCLVKVFLRTLILINQVLFTCFPF